MNEDFRFTSVFSNNAVIIIDGLRKSDMQTGLRLYNDLRDLRDYKKAVHIVERYMVQDAFEMRNVLEALRHRAQAGLRPVLHFECHGDAQEGLEIGEERQRMAWTTLEPLLRGLNVATKCNLGVVMAVCAGLHAITPVRIHRSTPFYFLVGSQNALLQGKIHDELSEFYRELLTSSDLDRALDRTPSFKHYHAERMLAVALGRFYRNGCMGVGADQRVEYLVTSSKWQLGGFMNREHMRAVRRLAKKKVKTDMSETTFRRFARPFLGTREPSFTFNDLALWVRSGT